MHLFEHERTHSVSQWREKRPLKQTSSHSLAPHGVDERSLLLYICTLRDSFSNIHKDLHTSLHYPLNIWSTRMQHCFQWIGPDWNTSVCAAALKRQQPAFSSTTSYETWLSSPSYWLITENSMPGVIAVKKKGCWMKKKDKLEFLFSSRLPI